MAEKEEEVTRMGESCLGGEVKGGKGWTGKKTEARGSRSKSGVSVHG